MSVASLWKRSRRHVRPLILMLILLPILAIQELENAWTDDPCALQESDQGFLAKHFYLNLSALAFRFHTKPKGPPVTIVFIDPEVEAAELLTNTCLSRRYIGQLVKDILPLGPRAIVIDKFYSDTACPADDDFFRNALNDNPTKIPIIVGQPTHLLADADKAVEACLSLAAPFNFQTPAGELPIQHGVTRLNSDVLKIPRHWPIAIESADKNAAPTNDDAPGKGDSLSLAAAQQVEDRDPELKKTAPLEALRSLKRDPYTSFFELPWINATAIRCEQEPKPIPDDKTPPDCAKVTHSQKVNLAGKVVVIGDRSDQDMQPFPDTKLDSRSDSKSDPEIKSQKERPGVFLQANYIQSILDSRFLHELPFFTTLIGLILFIIAVYCLHWFLTPRGALLVSSMALLAIILLSLFALLAFWYYTPLWALSSAAFFVLFRYLETRAHHYSTEVTEDGPHH